MTRQDGRIMMSLREVQLDQPEYFRHQGKAQNTKGENRDQYYCIITTMLVRLGWLEEFMIHI